MLKLGQMRFKGRIWKAGIAISGCGLLALFQNFSSIPLEKLRPRFNSVQARVINAHDGMDARDWAPERPSDMDQTKIATPQSGHDFSSVSEDWMRRQAHLITGGAEEEMLMSLNRRLNRLVSSVDEEESSSLAVGNARQNRGLSSDAGFEDGDGSFHLLPTSMKFTALNRLQMDFGLNTQVMCSFQGSSLQWDVVRPINTSIDMNLRHESGSSKSSVLLNYNW